jgi:hypothetical protein
MSRQLLSNVFRAEDVNRMILELIVAFRDSSRYNKNGLYRALHPSFERQHQQEISYAIGAFDSDRPICRGTAAGYYEPSDRRKLSGIRLQISGNTSYYLMITS